ncbi:MAG TPA: 50S ribosomal protein L15 [Dehalococcoidia bacterium]|nr:50S ribosomal protein L15 [Dehalococcoidia bacterium]
MMQHQVRAPAGARRARKRVGRGEASGHGKTSGRGMKGQKARTGGNIPPYFEGGQLPLVKRMPYTRGFVNIFKVEYSLVKAGNLEHFEAGAEVTPEAMAQAGLVKSLERPIKVLADGDLSKAITVHAHKFSAKAREKIEAAGGTVVEIANARRNP